MTRPFLRYTLFVKGANSEAIVTQNAFVTVKREGTLDDPIMWDEPVGGNPVTNPLVTNIQGEAECYLDDLEQSLVDLYVDDNSGGAYRAGQPGRPIGFPAFVEEDIQLVALGGVGPPGPPGASGAPGPPGPPGPSGSGLTGTPYARFAYATVTGAPPSGGPLVQYVGFTNTATPVDTDAVFTIERVTIDASENPPPSIHIVRSGANVRWVDRETTVYT